MGAAEKMVLWDSWLRGGVAESDWANVLASRHRYLLPTNPGCCVDRLSWQPKKDIVEDCLVLSIKELAQAGLLKTGCPSVSWRWRSGDKTVATVKLGLLIYPDRGTIWVTN